MATPVPVPLTDDPQNKVSIRVKTVDSLSADDRGGAYVKGDVIHQGADVGDATLFINNPAAVALIERGATYMMVKVSE